MERGSSGSFVKTNKILVMDVKKEKKVAVGLWMCYNTITPYGAVIPNGGVASGGLT